MQLTGPALTNGYIFGLMGGSLGPAITASTAVGNLNAFGTICQVTLNAAGVHGCHVEGTFLIGGSPGTIGIAAGIATASIIQMKAGSNVRSWKLN